MTKWNEETLLSTLKEAAEKPGLFLTFSSLSEEYGEEFALECVSKYGSLGLGFEEAGYSKDLLKQHLRTLREELNRPAVWADMRAKRKETDSFPRADVFAVVFGSILNAVEEELGRVRVITHMISKKIYTKKNLLADFQALTDELDQTPRARDITIYHQMGFTANLNTFYDNNIKLRGSLKTKEDKLSDLRAIAQELGHSPSKQEIIDASKKKKCLSYFTYNKNFGSLENMLEAAELPPTGSQYPEPDPESSY